MPIAAKTYIIYQPEDGTVWDRIELEPGQRIPEEIPKKVVDQWKEEDLVEDRREEDLVIPETIGATGKSIIKPPSSPPLIQGRLKSIHPVGSMAAMNSPSPPRPKKSSPSSSSE
jgi:hypothetical protein